MLPVETILGIMLVLYILFLMFQIVRTIRSSAIFPQLTEFPNEKQSLSKVSIIVPARNCGRTIRNCLDSLLLLEYPKTEIVVIDGGSTDETRAILDSYGNKVTVIDETELPSGWTGKNWACHLGFLNSNGDYLLFTDADTVHSPKSLSLALSQILMVGIDMLSLSPRVELRSFSERALVPLIFLTIQDVARRANVNDDKSSTAWAVGEYVLMSKANYSKIGGHARIRGRIDEDLSLAHNGRRMGLKVRLMDGWNLLSMTMYDSFSALLAGFVRNFYGLAMRMGQKFAEITLKNILYFVLPLVALIAGIIELVVSHANVIGLLGCALFLVSLGQIWVYDRKLGLNPAFSLLAPFSSLVVLSIQISSAARFLTGRGVSWRGRTYNATTSNRESS